MEGIIQLAWSRGSLPRYLPVVQGIWNLAHISDLRARISGEIVWYDALTRRPEALLSCYNCWWGLTRPKQQFLAAWYPPGWYGFAHAHDDSHTTGLMWCVTTCFHGITLAHAQLVQNRSSCHIGVKNIRVRSTEYYKRKLSSVPVFSTYGLSFCSRSKAKKFKLNFKSPWK